MNVPTTGAAGAARLLHGKVAVVTGGATGIGRATAQLLAEAGACVVVADIAEAQGRRTAEDIAAAGGSASFLRVDVRSARDCEALVSAAIDRHGGLDIAFNNAGYSGATSLTEDQGLEQWRQVLDVNLTGVFNSMVPQLRAMKAKGGAIVNTASLAGMGGTKGAAAYCASKHGVIGLTRTAALEYARHAIRINCISPGLIATPMTVGEAALFEPRNVEQMLSAVPLRRMGTAREPAEMVLWLCSERASYVTGSNFVVDGGVTASY